MPRCNLVATIKTLRCFVGGSAFCCWTRHANLTESDTMDNGVGKCSISYEHHGNKEVVGTFQLPPYDGWNKVAHASNSVKACAS